MTMNAVRRRRLDLTDVSLAETDALPVTGALPVTEVGVRASWGADITAASLVTGSRLLPDRPVSADLVHTDKFVPSQPAVTSQGRRSWGPPV